MILYRGWKSEVLSRKMGNESITVLEFTLNQSFVNRAAKELDSDLQTQLPA